MSRNPALENHIAEEKFNTTTTITGATAIANFYLILFSIAILPKIREIREHYIITNLAIIQRLSSSLGIRTSTSARRLDDFSRSYQ